MAITDFSFAAVNDRNRRREMETYGPPRKSRDGFPVLEPRPWLFGNEEWYLEGETWRRMPGAPNGCDALTPPSHHNRHHGEQHQEPPQEGKV